MAHSASRPLALLTLTLCAVIGVSAVTNCQWNGYDLTTLASDQTYTVTDHFYNGFVCGVVATAGQCQTKNGALCMFSADHPPVYQNLLAVWDGSGAWSQIDDTQPALGVQVSFANGDTCGNGKYSVTFKFPCGTAAAKPLVVTSLGSCQYLVTYQNMATCKGGTVKSPSGGGGISGGSVFLIIFFVGGFVYVALGCLYKRQKMGAAGMESCPNIDFWRTLPGLVADGFRFTFAKLRGCCAGSGGGSTSYDEVK